MKRVCVCVCVCVRKRGRKRQREKDWQRNRERERERERECHLGNCGAKHKGSNHEDGTQGVTAQRHPNAHTHIHACTYDPT